MPQLDPSTFPPQLIWLAITFIALYLVMLRMVLPKIGGAIEHRKDRIAGDLDQAQSLKDDTDKAIAAYEERLAEARANAHSIAQATRQRLSEELEAERARIDADIAGKIESAERNIAEVKAKALKEVEKVASDLAGDIVAQLIGSKVTKTKAAKAVEEASGR